MSEERMDDPEAEGGAIDPPHNSPEEIETSLSPLDSDEGSSIDPPHNT